jgi:peptidoglycan/LPS O-acetylase OafA/YrhL
MVPFSQAFHSRRNSLNALRLFLAVLVIVSHSSPINGFGGDPGFGDLSPGSFGVYGFFAISGYLIIGSRLNAHSFVDYFWRRALRIYPAFLICLVVVAFVFAPVSLFWSGGPLDAASAGNYVLNNVGLFIKQWGIKGTLDSVPFIGSWNGSLWTLFYEFVCYLAIGIAASIIPRRFLKPALGAAVILAMGFMVLNSITRTGAEFPILLEVIHLGGFFAAGAALYLWRETLPSHWALAALSFVAIFVTAHFGLSRALATIPMAYLMMYLGARLPLHRIGAKNDISYGMYIYAFPVQQLIVTALPGQQLSQPGYILLAIVATVPLAMASWFAIEKPAMRLKTLFSRSIRPAATP